MTYSSKQTKNKSKVRKTKRQNKRTRRFRNYLGGKLNPKQLAFIQGKIADLDLDFNEEEKMEINDYFNQISQPLSKKLAASRTPLLEEFFINVDRNCKRKQKKKRKEIFLGMLSNMYFHHSGNEGESDKEDDEDD